MWNTKDHTMYMNNSNHSEEMIPQNILLKLSWGSSIELLNQKERSSILINIFNYHTGKTLVPLSKTANMLFSAMKDVFEYNWDRYNKKVEANRENGKRGGRKRKNPENPSGSLNNPENPKEKDKGIDRDKFIDKGIDDGISSYIENDKVKGPEREPNKDFQMLYMKKFADLLLLNYAQCSDPDERRYVLYANQLHKNLGPDLFSKLIFNPEALDIPALTKEHKLESSISEIGFIRKHMIYYLGKLVK